MLDYNLDISQQSISQPYTSANVAKSFPFYINTCGYFEAGSGYYTVRDSKQASLLLFTHAGQGEMKYKDTQCVLEPGSAVLVNCMALHEYRTISAEPWVFYWMHFEGKKFNQQWSIFRDITRRK